MRKDTRLSPLFRTASDKSWAGPGNEATLVQLLYEAKQETDTFVSRWLTAVVHKQSKLFESRTAGFMCTLGNFKVCLCASSIREAVNGFGVLLQG